MTSDITYYVWRGPGGIYASFTRPSWDARERVWVGTIGDFILNPEAFALLLGIPPAMAQLNRVTVWTEYDVPQEADAPVCVGGCP